MYRAFPLPCAKFISRRESLWLLRNYMLSWRETFTDAAAKVVEVKSLLIEMKMSVECFCFEFECAALFRGRREQV